MTPFRGDEVSPFGRVSKLRGVLAGARTRSTSARPASTMVRAGPTRPPRQPALARHQHDRGRSFCFPSHRPGPRRHGGSGGEGRIRTSVGVSQQIYSLPRLAASVPLRRSRAARCRSASSSVPRIPERQVEHSVRPRSHRRMPAPSPATSPGLTRTRGSSPILCQRFELLVPRKWIRPSDKRGAPA